MHIKFFISQRTEAEVTVMEEYLKYFSLSSGHDVGIVLLNSQQL